MHRPLGSKRDARILESRIRGKDSGSRLIALLVLERGDCPARFLRLFTPRHIVRGERFVNRLIKTH